MSSRAIERASAYLDANRPEQARTELAGALTEDPESFEALCLAALAELQLERWVASHGFATRALRIDPEAEWPMRLIAIAYLNAGDVALAQRAAADAVRADPDVWQAHQVRTLAALDAGRLDEARAGLQEVLRLHGDAPAAHVLAARVALHAGDGAGTERSLRAALALDPEQAEAIDLLARLSLQRRDAGAAAAGFAWAVARDPGSSAATFNVGQAATVALWWTALLLLVLSLTDVVLAGAGGATLGARIAALAAGLAVVAVVLRYLRSLRRRLGPRWGPVTRAVASDDPLLGVWAAGLGLVLLVLLVAPLLPRYSWLGLDILAIYGLLIGNIVVRISRGARRRALERGGR